MLPGETEFVQLCLDYPRVEAFEVNDFIKFRAHKQGKGEWTIHFEEKVTRKQPLPSANTVSEGKQTDVSRQGMYQDEWVGVNNPVMIGTAIDRAFAHTAHFLQMRGNVSDDDFIALAKRVHSTMLQEHRLPF